MTIAAILLFILIIGLIITQYILYSFKLWFLLAMIFTVIPYGVLYFLTFFKGVKGDKKDKFFGAFIILTIVIVSFLFRANDGDNWILVFIAPLFVVHLTVYAYKLGIVGNKE